MRCSINMAFFSPVNCPGEVLALPSGQGDGGSVLTFCLCFFGVDLVDVGCGMGLGEADDDRFMVSRQPLAFGH